jgi:hypothetical protein
MQRVQPRGEGGGTTVHQKEEAELGLVSLVIQVVGAQLDTQARPAFKDILFNRLQ